VVLQAGAALVEQALDQLDQALWPLRSITYLWKFHCGALPVRAARSANSGLLRKSVTLLFSYIGNSTP
jgi:hypothetical protein